MVAFHDADIGADIVARIVAIMSACSSACRRNNFRKSRVSDVSARILARMSVSVSASWNVGLTTTPADPSTRGSEGPYANPAPIFFTT